MYDNSVISTSDIDLINIIKNKTTLQENKNIKNKAPNKDYYILEKYNIRFVFTKAYDKKTNNFLGYNYLSISFNPHKIFNNNIHNGNRLTILNALNVIDEFMAYLNISKVHYKDFRVTSLEFGVNVSIRNHLKIIDRTIAYKRDFMVTPNAGANYYKNSKVKDNQVSYLKLYSKTEDLKDKHNIESAEHSNLMRFELKINKAQHLRDYYKISSLEDLFNIDKINNLANGLIKSIDNLLMLEPNPSKTDYIKNDFSFLELRSKKKYWVELIKKGENNNNFRRKFEREKEKYNKISRQKNRVKKSIISEINACLFSVKKSSKSVVKILCKTHPDKTNTNPLLIDDTENLNSSKNVAKILTRVVKWNFYDKKECLITGLDIRMQRRQSKLLGVGGVKYYYKNNFKIYSDLCSRFLPSEKSKEDLATKFYLIAHNVRNEYYNPLQKVIKIDKVNQLSLF